MSRKRKIDDKKLEWALDKRRNGYTLEEIAEALDVTRNGIHTALMRKYGNTGKCIKEPLVYVEEGK